MNTVRLDTASARTLLTAIHRPCPGCRWCQTRRVLTAVWRGLDLASWIAMSAWRALLLCVGFVHVVFAVAHEYGRWMGVASTVAMVAAGMALMVADTREGRR